MAAFLREFEDLGTVEWQLLPHEPVKHPGHSSKVPDPSALQISLEVPTILQYQFKSTWETNSAACGS